MNYSNSSADDVSFLDHSRLVSASTSPGDYRHNTDYSAHPRRPSALESRQPLWQNPEIRRERTPQQRSSWIATLSSWRLSRSELDPHTLAVFTPLENDTVPLDIAIPSQEHQTILQHRTLEKGVSPPSHNRDLGTRNLCILTVFLGVSIAVASIAIGTRIIMLRKWTAPAFVVNKFINMGNSNYLFFKAPKYVLHYISGHRIFSLNKTAMLLASLLLNIGLTSVFDGMNLILSATLRWTLFHEGNLVFNSNSRLYTSSRDFGPCHWTMNILSTIALVLGYGAISILATNIYIISMINPDDGTLSNDPITGSRYALDFNAWGMIGLGCALLLQAGICIWALISGRKIVKSWSSNALGTTHAYVCAEYESLSTISRDPNLPWYARRSFVAIDTEWKSSGGSERTLHSRTSSKDHPVAKPCHRQPSASSCVPLARRLTNIIWVILGTVSIWVLVVGIAGKKTGSCSANYVMTSAYRTDILAYWQTYCQLMIPYFNLQADPLFDRRDWLGLIIQSVGFSFISLGLHCVELLTEVDRDEWTWRKATTTGADPETGAFMQRMSSWPGWVLFGFKCITPWIFGYAYTANLWLYMNLLPLCALMLVFLLLALFSEYLIRRRPDGPQPAAYGNLHKLATFVDEWDHDRLFWGDKGEISDKVRKCGTAGRRLAEVDMRMKYAGLRA